MTNEQFTEIIKICDLSEIRKRLKAKGYAEARTIDEIRAESVSDILHNKRFTTETLTARNPKFRFNGTICDYRQYEILFIQRLRESKNAIITDTILIYAIKEKRQ